jgi:histidinol-phosphatase
LNSDLRFAHSIADAADQITMKYFRAAGLAVKTKSDKTPVSEADEAVEKMIRERLAAERPNDGIVGEEFGEAGSGRRRWIIDPIDGTKNYVRGVPVWATLLALEEDGKITTGVVASPAMHRRWWAALGDGAFCNGNRLRVSSVASIDKAFVGYDSVTDFRPHDRFLQLLQQCERSRGLGDFWIHMLVAEGAIDIAVEPRVAIWDMAPIQIIVDEAGGKFTNLAGKTGPAGGSGLSTNGLLHETMVRFFA